MAIRVSTGMANAIWDGGINAAIGSDGLLNVYAGTQPDDADDDVSGTLLATLTLAATPFGAAAAAAVAAASITNDSSADAGGTAGWARLFKNSEGAGGSSATKRRIDFAIGEGSGDISFDETAVTAGGIVAIGGLTLTWDRNEV